MFARKGFTMIPTTMNKEAVNPVVEVYLEPLLKLHQLKIAQHV
jgi:hypothetical protein